MYVFARGYLKTESEMSARWCGRSSLPARGGWTRGGECRARPGGEMSRGEASPHPGSLTLADPPLAGREGTEQAAKKHCSSLGDLLRPAPQLLIIKMRRLHRPWRLVVAIRVVARGLRWVAIDQRPEEHRMRQA